MPELSLDDLDVFVRVVERGGFAPAARELRVPTSTVSRAIERLEASAEARLLHRTTRNLRPTSEGQRLFDAVAASVAALRGAARAVEPATRQPTGRLRVTAPGKLCTAFLSKVVVAFAEHYPDVQLDFAVTNQRADLVREGFDVAVRAAGQLPDSSLVARKLGTLEHRLYASPGYLKQHGLPTTTEDLGRHRCVVFRAPELARSWALRGPRGETAPVEVRGAVGGDDFDFIHSIVLAGGGVGLMPHMLCAEDEAAGRLVRVLPGYSATGATLYVVYPSARHVPLRVRAFRDFVAEAFDAWQARHR